MKLDSGRILASTYVGLYASITNKVGLFPKNVDKKHIKEFEEFFGIEIIQTSIASSPLIGALVRGNSKGFLLPKIAEESEIDELKNFGIKTKVINEDCTALGNLIAMNDNHIIISEVFGTKTVKQIEKFFDMKVLVNNFAKSQLTGSSLLMTNKGFIVNPGIAKQEFEFIKKTLKIEGEATTANYGDAFVSNSVLANDEGVLVGEKTTSHEVTRIDSALRK
ncbi:MAG: translation initiation factor IF-6 [Candidatus Diapherotrites archaeon]|nr:translation initiation factor IF-6 [Candidatus Diapherotrites archaeon]